MRWGRARRFAEPVPIVPGRVRAHNRFNRHRGCPAADPSPLPTVRGYHKFPPGSLAALARPIPCECPLSWMLLGDYSRSRSSSHRCPGCATSQLVVRQGQANNSGRANTWCIYLRSARRAHNCCRVHLNRRELTDSTRAITKKGLRDRLTDGSYGFRRVSGNHPAVFHTDLRPAVQKPKLQSRQTSPIQLCRRALRGMLPRCSSAQVVHSTFSIVAEGWAISAIPRTAGAESASAGLLDALIAGCAVLRSRRLEGPCAVSRPRQPK